MIEINKIHLMDCIEGMKQIPDGSIDAVISDPPYGISFLSPRTENHHEIANDGHDDFLDCLGSWLDQFHRITKKDSVCCCFCVGGAKHLYRQSLQWNFPSMASNSYRLCIVDEVRLGCKLPDSGKFIYAFCQETDSMIELAPLPQPTNNTEEDAEEV